MKSSYRTWLSSSAALNAGMRFQESGRGEEVLAGLLLIELGKLLARLVLVAGIAADRRERVGREGEVALEADAPGDVLDVRIEAAVLVHDEDAGELARGLG